MVFKSALSLALVTGLTVSAVAQTATNFDVLRGNAYANSAFANAAGAFTVADQIVWPHLMNGNKFLYVEPTNESGTVAWTQGSFTPFISLQNASAGGIGLTTFGFAKGNIGLDFSIAKNSAAVTVTDTANRETSTSMTDLGDMLGVNFSMNLGALALQANASLTTVEQQIVVENNEDANYQFIAGVQVSNFPAAKSLYWFAGITFDRLNISNTVNDTNVFIDADSRTQIRLAGSQGMKILGNDKSRVLIGADESVVVTMADDITPATRKGSLGVGLFIAPNIVGEFAFNDSWLFVGGAKHTIKVIETGSVTTGNGTPSEVEIFARTHETSQTTASVGTRFQKGNFAAEVSISDALFADGSSALFSGSGLLSTFGAFLNF